MTCALIDRYSLIGPERVKVVGTFAYAFGGSNDCCRTVEVYGMRVNVCVRLNSMQMVNTTQVLNNNNVEKSGPS